MLYKGFSRTILVIGDNPMGRKTISRNLEYYEYEVLEGTGAEGLEIFRDRHYDIGLVILDVKTGDSPDETLNALREISPDIQVALCAELTPTERKGGLQGIAGIVRKPVQMNRLLAVVRSVLKEDDDDQPS